MKYWLSPALNNLDTGEHTLDKIFTLQGEVYRDLPSRKTCRFVNGDQTYFLKTHLGVGWSEIVKNISQGKLPITNAITEANAIQKLHAANIPTMTLAGYGCRGVNPARQQSFLITKEITNTLDLEKFTHSQTYRELSFKQKQRIIHTLAELVQRFQQSGFVHYDFYLCHFLLKQHDFDNPQIFLIDCHRVQQYKKLPVRMRVRDLGALYFSSLHLPITQRDRLRFLKQYFNLPLRELFTNNAYLLKKIARRAQRLNQRVHGNCPRPLHATIESLAKLPFELQYLDCIFQHQGNTVATSKLNDTYFYKHDSRSYFVKRYYAAGKGLRRFIGRSRLQGELENLDYFASLGLSIPTIARFTEQRRFGVFKRGVLITQAITQVIDLKSLKRQQHECFQQQHWRRQLLTRIADIAKLLHQQGFIHQDFKWRNILVCPIDANRLFFIDCPIGHKRYWHWYKRGVIKDLMSLDKEANGFLSKTERLRFYLRYQGKSRLDVDDKTLIAQIQAAYR